MKVTVMYAKKLPVPSIDYSNQEYAVTIEEELSPGGSFEQAEQALRHQVFAAVDAALPTPEVPVATPKQVEFKEEALPDSLQQPPPQEFHPANEPQPGAASPAEQSPKTASSDGDGFMGPDEVRARCEWLIDAIGQKIVANGGDISVAALIKDASMFESKGKARYKESLDELTDKWRFKTMKKLEEKARGLGISI